MCSMSECGRYCVRIMMSKIPEFTQLESVKSMIRYLPANGTAGFARRSVSTPRRCPSPPARMTARVLTGAPCPRSGGGSSSAAIPHRFAIERFVYRRRPVPREVLLHPAPLEHGPFFALSVHPQGALERLSERAGIVSVEEESRSAGIADIGNRIGQTAGSSRDRDRAVAHRDHLGEAARLVTGRNQNPIRAAIDLPRIRWIEPESDARSAAELELEVGERALDREIAAAEHDELASGVEPAHEGGERDVESLLGVEPRHHPQEKGVLVRLESRLLPERGLVRRAAFERPRVEALAQSVVRRRIPGLGVDSVQHSMKPVPPCRQRSFETVSALGSENLPRVSRADGREHVRARQAETEHRVACPIRQEREPVG